MNGQGDRTIRATHLIFFLHLTVFLVLVVGDGAAWHQPLISTLAVSDFAGVASQPWTLITYLVLNIHPLEFVISSAILLLAGVPLETRLGRPRFLLLYGASGILVALAHTGALEAGLVEARLFTGAVGASCALLTAYLFVFGGQRQVGTVPFPVFYLITASFLFMVMVLVSYHNEVELKATQDEILEDAYAATDRTLEQRWEDLDQVATLQRQRSYDELGHLLGLVLGALSLFFSRQLVRMRARYRVMREIRGLQEEVDARARVEVLLVKISREGMGALTRHERKFLRYASRFYRSRTPTSC